MADDLATLLNLFNKNVSNIVSYDAIKGAKDVTDQIRASQMDEGEKRQAFQETANRLALDLSAVGADPNQVAQSFKAVAPMQFDSAQAAILEGTLSQNQGLTDMGSKALRLQDAPTQERFNKTYSLQREQFAWDKNKDMADLLLKQRDAGKKIGGDSQKLFVDAQSDFNSAIKDDMKALGQVRSAREALASNNPVADEAIKTMLAKASGEVGNLTETERDMFGGSKSIMSRLRRMGQRAASGELPEEDKQLLFKLLDVYENGTNSKITGQAELRASQLSKITGIEPEKAAGVIYPDYKFQAETASQYVFDQKYAPLQQYAKENPDDPRSQRFNQQMKILQERRQRRGAPGKAAPKRGL